MTQQVWELWPADTSIRRHFENINELDSVSFDRSSSPLWWSRYQAECVWYEDDDKQKESGKSEHLLLKWTKSRRSLSRVHKLESNCNSIKWAMATEDVNEGGSYDLVPRTFPKEICYIDAQINSLFDVHLHPGLISINLHCNNISEIENLDGLKNLKHLDLSSNRIKRIQGLNGLKSLVTLNLSCNELLIVEGLENLRYWSVCLSWCSGTLLYWHPYVINSFFCPDGNKLIYFSLQWTYLKRIPG